MITKFKIYEQNFLKFESIRTKNLIAGEVYVIDSIMIAKKGWRKNIPLGKIVRIHTFDYSDKIFLDVETYIEETGEEFIFEPFDRRLIKRKATPEEKQEFEVYPLLKKYNV